MSWGSFSDDGGQNAGHGGNDLMDSLSTYTESTSAGKHSFSPTMATKDSFLFWTVMKSSFKEKQLS